MRYIFLSTIFSVVFAYEKDITFTVQAGKIDCFYHKVKVNEIIDLDYQVIDSTHGELDISFQLADPMGLVLIAEYKKPENAHKLTAELEGDYRFCFDNTFSTFSEKTVFFDLMIVKEEPESPEKDYDEGKELEFGNDAGTYMVRVADILQSLGRVSEHVTLARRLQEQQSAHEARDRNLAEDMCARVLKWSLVQILIMMAVGVIQVFFVKSLFEDNRGGIKKFMPGFVSQ